jgi:membrane fusion protein (multidrug efflux system)
MDHAETLHEQNAPPRRGHRKKLIGLVACGAALLVAAKLGCGWWTEGRFIESTDDAYVGGNVTAIAPHVAGFVAKILVADNQHVRAGDLLVMLDDRDYRAATERAQASLRERQAAFTSLSAQYILQNSVIRQAEAGLESKRAQAVFAAQDSQRYHKLASGNAASWQDAQRTFALDLQARAAIAAAQAALDAARQKLAVLQADTSQARAGVAEAEATRKIASLNLGYTEIRSPVAGYVGNRAAQTGAYMAQGGYLLSIVPDRGLWVDANFKEDQLSRIVPGQTVSVLADVVPNHIFHGHVESLAPGTGAIFSIIPPENATGNFTKIVQRVPVRIALDDDGATLGLIRPGLSVTANVDTRAAFMSKLSALPASYLLASAPKGAQR